MVTIAQDKAGSYSSTIRFPEMLGLATLNEITEGNIHSSHQFSSALFLGQSTEISVLFFFFYVLHFWSVRNPVLDQLRLQYHLWTQSSYFKWLSMSRCWKGLLNAFSRREWGRLRPVNQPNGLCTGWMHPNTAINPTVPLTLYIPALPVLSQCTPLVSVFTYVRSNNTILCIWQLSDNSKKKKIPYLIRRHGFANITR